jgi:hypothetical protein
VLGTVVNTIGLGDDGTTGTVGLNEDNPVTAGAVNKAVGIDANELDGRLGIELLATITNDGFDEIVTTGTLAGTEEA